MNGGEITAAQRERILVVNGKEFSVVEKNFGK